METTRLVLRELVESDIPAYEKHFINYSVIRNLTALVPWPYPEDGVKSYVSTNILPNQGKGKWVWAITLKAVGDDLVKDELVNDELIGAIELSRVAAPANRGFWLGEKYWGNGYMTEAAEAVNDYAFNKLGFDRLIFENALGNNKSRRIKEKTGARFLRNVSAKYVDPELTEAEIFELTKEDWIKFKSSESTNS